MRVILVGLFLGLLYMVTGSLWLPMLAQFLLDVLPGATILEIPRDDKMPAPQIATLS
ncbi:MAG: hypothetical protein OEV41_00290 [Gammaproteobacteria bacterium]|nr:hypothetical protein [Gammaproteobacteria bacterium]MDH5344461.1 hypothetical protein [Gammaproteobacteria bacterium]